MLTNEQSQVGQWVTTNQDWPGVLAGSAGIIIEDYGSGIMVEWKTMGREPRVDKLRDGFNRKGELQFLDPLRAPWVPYLMTMEGEKLGKIDLGDMSPFYDTASLLDWYQNGQPKTHPELNGQRIDAFQEPEWPQHT